jgi:3-deoxy-manno-octulosonate cytidylyltransferase (CMP-KDO synthetase)
LRYAVLIPARLASTRLPDKPLADIAGVPMVVRVAQRSRQSGAERVVVAADDARIVTACEAHGVEVLLTRTDHASGSDRLAEACVQLGLADDEIVVNVQGDEPLIDPAMIAQALEPFADAAVEMTTLCRPADAHDFTNPNVVKAVVGQDGYALFFSRAPVPYDRTGRSDGRADGGAPRLAFKHIGLYAYRRTTLLRLAALPPTALEETEMLEQLRALEHGIRIKVVQTELDSIGVDTDADVARVRALLAASPAVSSARPVHDHAQP